MKIASKALTAVVAVGIGLGGATVPAVAAEPSSAGTVAPSAKKIQVGVAPSPNGYVMANVPTQIAVNKKATVYQRVGNKWIQLGKATPTKAVPVTFKSNGIKKLRVKSGKKSKIGKVGVYERFSGKAEPTQYGDLILPSAGTVRKGETFTLPASRGCVLMDVGIKSDYDSDSPYSFSFSVASTGADPFNSPILTSPDSYAVRDIPVAGDIVVTYYYDGPSFWTSNGYPKTGLERTCLNSP